MKTRLQIHRARLLALLVVTFVGTGSSGLIESIAMAKSAKPGLPGVWILDVEASKAIQPKQKKPGFFSNLGKSTSVSIGGIPLPKSNKTKPPETRGRSRDPDILFCTSMTFAADERSVRIDYDGLGAKTFTIGKYRGRKTSYNGNIMSTSYESTSRKVSQKYVLDGPDRIIATIVLNPNSGAKSIIKKVFNRSTTE